MNFSKQEGRFQKLKSKPCDKEKVVARRFVLFVYNEYRDGKRRLTACTLREIKVKVIEKSKASGLKANLNANK